MSCTQYGDKFLTSILKTDDLKLIVDEKAFDVLSCVDFGSIKEVKDYVQSNLCPTTTVIGNKSNGGSSGHFTCSGCNVFRANYLRPRGKGRLKFSESSNFEHSQVCVHADGRKLTQKQLAADPKFVELCSSKGRGKGITAEDLRNTFKADAITISTNIAKKAKMAIAPKPDKVVIAFAKSEAYALEIMRLNPGSEVDIQKEADGTFIRLALLLPGAVSAFQYGLHIVGIDGAHFKDNTLQKIKGTVMTSHVCDLNHTFVILLCRDCFLGGS
jgi:hypothetical protein